MSQIGINETSGQVVFKFYSSSNSTPDVAGFPITGYEHYVWEDTFKRMICTKCGGYVDASYNPENHNFSLSSSITSIVVEFPDEKYRPSGLYAEHYYMSNTNSIETGAVATQLKLRPDQWFIIKGVSGDTIFSQERSLSDVIAEVNAYGLSAFDMIWDGSQKYNTLTAMEYSVSGEFISTADEGDVWVSNIDPFVGFPDGYDYNGNQSITTNINSLYNVIRFGPVKQGTTGYDIPSVYCEDGKISNAAATKPVINSYYDMLRWLEKPLTSNYEIMYFGDSDSTSRVNSDTFLGDTWTETLEGPLSSYPDITNYSGSAAVDVTIRRHRDQSYKMWDGGSYLKYLASEEENVFNLLRCAHSPASAESYYGATLPYVFEFLWTASAYPINTSFENVSFEYLFQHAWDGPTCLSETSVKSRRNSLTGAYWINPSTSATFYWSGFAGHSDVYDLDDAPDGLSGYPRNWASDTLNNAYCVYIRNPKRFKADNVSISSCNTGGMGLGISWYNNNTGMSLTSYECGSVKNCYFGDIIGRGFGATEIYGSPSIYSSGTDRVFDQGRQQWEWPSSGWEISDNDFVRCGEYGFNAAYAKSFLIYDNTCDTCCNLIFSSRKTAFIAQASTTSAESFIYNNIVYNCQIVSTNPWVSIYENSVIYNWTDPGDYEKYNPGRCNGLDIYTPINSNVYSIDIFDNTCLGVPEDAILCEGGAPWGHPFQSSTAVGTKYANHPENNKAGRLQNITITGNIFQSRAVVNYSRFEIGDQKVYQSSSYSTIWLSDTHDTIFYNNTVLGSDFFTGTDYYGQTISADALPLFILDSVSGIDIQNNKLAFGKPHFRITFGSGMQSGSTYVSDGYWGGAGSFSEITIANNKIFETFRGFFDFDTSPYFEGEIPASAFESYGYWQNNRMNASGLEYYSDLVTNNVTVRGDNNDGTFKGLYVYDNEWIQFDSDYYTNKITANNGGYPVDVDDSSIVRGISLRTFDNDRDLESLGDDNWFIYRAEVPNAKWLSENSFMADDNSVLSGNTWYNYDQSTRNIEWMEYLDDIDIYIDTTYDDAAPPSNGVSCPFLTFSSVSADNYSDLVDVLYDGNGWFIHQQFMSYGSYGEGMRLSESWYNTSSEYFWIPLSDRIYQTTYDDSLYNLSDWVDYMNTTSSGMRGTQNSVSSDIPDYNYYFDSTNTSAFLENLPATAGVDVDKKQAIFRLYRNENSVHSNMLAGWTSSGFEHYNGRDLEDMIGYKIRGEVDSTYNPEGYFFASSASITSVVIEMEGGEHVASYEKLYSPFNYASSSVLDLNLREDQWLIIKSEDPLNKAIISRGRLLSDVVSYNSSSGLSSYDLIWDGSSKYHTLLNIEQTISGSIVSTEDEGDIFVPNPDPHEGYTESYDYNGNQSITTNINSSYDVYRFGPFRHGDPSLEFGVTGYGIPCIYMDDGRLANAYELSPVVNTYYDLIRWLNKDLPATADFEVLFVANVGIAETNSNSIVGNPLTETLDGILSSYSWVNYSGTAADVTISSYRDSVIKPWESGQYLKVRKTKITETFNSLTASYSNIEDTNPRQFEFFRYYSDGNYPFNLKIQDIDVKFVGQWTWDPILIKNNHPHFSEFESYIEGEYEDVVGTSAFYWSGPFNVSRTTDDLPYVGASGYPANWMDKWRSTGYFISIENVGIKNVEFENCYFGNECNHFLGIYINQGSDNTSETLSGGVSAYDGISFKNCKFNDTYTYSTFLYPRKPWSELESRIEYPSSATIFHDCEFNRNGYYSIYALGYGKDTSITGCLFNNSRYLVNCSGRVGIQLISGDSSLENPVLFYSNTGYNNYFLFAGAALSMTGCYFDYTNGPEDFDKFGTGGKNCLSLKTDFYKNPEGYYIAYNTLLNAPEDSLLMEGVTPWGNRRDVTGKAPAGTPNTEFTGRLSGITAHDNIFSSKTPYNKIRFGFNSRKVRSTYAGVLWLSDTHDSIFYDNMIYTKPPEDGVSYGVDEYGVTITAHANYAIIIDSVSGITISSNRIAFCGDQFYISQGSGMNGYYPSSFKEWAEDGFSSAPSAQPYFQGWGQCNDLTIANNTIFNCNNTMIRLSFLPYFSGTWASSAFNSVDWWKVNELPASSTLEEMGQLDPKLGGTWSVTGKGDGYSYHLGKSKNWKIINNTFIQDYSYGSTATNISCSAFYAYYPIIDSFKNSSTAYNYSGRNLIYIQHSLRDSTPQNVPEINNSYWVTDYTVQEQPWYIAENLAFDDDNSTISGNSFIGYNYDDPSCEWIVWKTTSAVTAYVESEYRPGDYNSYVSSPYNPANSTFLSVTAFYNNEFCNLSSSSNWWMHDFDLDASLYAKNNGIPVIQSTSYTHVSPTGDDNDIRLYIPKPARVKSISGDGLLTLSSWTEYLNNATTGMRGINNNIISEYPLLDYTFNENNLDGFLKPISALSASEYYLDFGTGFVKSDWNVYNLSNSPFNWSMSATTVSAFSLTYPNYQNPTANIVTIPLGESLSGNSSTNPTIIYAISMGLWPDSYIAYSTLSADNGESFSISSVIEKESSGSYSAYPKTLNFGKTEDILTFTVHNINLLESLSINNSVDPTYNVEPSWITYSPDFSSTNIISSGNDLLVSVTADRTLIPVGTSRNGIINLVTSDGTYPINVLIEREGLPIEGSQNEENSSGGRPEYPVSIETRVMENMFEGSLEELYEIIDTFSIKKVDFKSLDKGLKEWFKQYLDENDINIDTDIFAILNTNKLLNIFKKSEEPRFLSMALENYLNDISKNITRSNKSLSIKKNIKTKDELFIDVGNWVMKLRNKR